MYLLRMTSLQCIYYSWVELGCLVNDANILCGSSFTTTMIRPNNCIYHLERLATGLQQYERKRKNDNTILIRMTMSSKSYHGFSLDEM
mmetsp:Transcript_46933/g.50664  ORF Transcript_46933/g.50664 Transcript_46933/m.50664 type:complete len:88 (+) Transcript_46933:840-1103(+)